MKLVFIRHGEPDYTRDSLTEKGMREAAYLGERVKEWKVDGLYVSCLGRARKTAEPVEAALGRKGIVLDWLQEFRAKIDPKYGTGWTGYTWDPECFPDPERFLAGLHARGMKTTLNVHPADGIRAFEDC